MYSAEYKALLVQAHTDDPAWGTTAPRHARDVAEMARAAGTRNILDYGAGKGELARELESIFPEAFDVAEYDPAIEGKDASPEPCKMVACIDVIEHVEPECIDAVLDDLQRCITGTGYLVISTQKALKILSDGRNAHLLIKPFSFWQAAISSRFKVVLEENKNDSECKFTVVPLGNKGENSDL